MISVEQLFGLDEEEPEYTAAVQLAEALRQNPGRKPLSVWKKTVAKSLGVKRLHKKRYDKVLKKGVENGLFVIKEDSHKPYLELGDAVEEAVEEAKSEDPEPEPEVGDPAPDPKPEPKGPPPKPEKFEPPTYLDCGHMNWGSPEDHAKAREEGFCCDGGKSKHAVNYRYLKGKFRKPVPKGLRRSKERAQGMGYPGLCCDEEGYFIGGTFNDCRREGKLCAYHKEELELRQNDRKKKSKE